MTDTEKREKVIKWLAEEAVEHEEEEVRDLAHTALLMLEEQEPRVMTFEEIKDNIGVPVWVEYADDENWNGYGVPTAGNEVYIMIFGVNAHCMHNAPSDNVKWRCWTSRPTPEQMRDTPWEGEDNG